MLRRGEMRCTTQGQSIAARAAANQPDCTLDSVLPKANPCSLRRLRAPRPNVESWYTNSLFEVSTIVHTHGWKIDRAPPEHPYLA